MGIWWFGMSASAILVPGQVLDSLLMQFPANVHPWRHQMVIRAHHSCGRPGFCFWLLVLIWPSSGCCGCSGVNQGMEGLYVSLSLSLSLKKSPEHDQKMQGWLRSQETGFRSSPKLKLTSLGYGSLPTPLPSSSPCKQEIINA